MEWKSPEDQDADIEINDCNQDDSKQNRHPATKMLEFKSTPNCPWYRDQRFDHYWQHYNSIMSWQQQQNQMRQMYDQMNQQMAVYAHMVNSCYSNPNFAQQMQSWLPQQGQGVNTLNQTVSGQRVPGPIRRQGKNSRSKCKTQYSSGPVTSMVKQESGKLNHDNGNGASAMVEHNAEQFELHISEDFMEFFEKSAQHRKERDAAKKTDEEDGDQNKDYVDLEKVTAGVNNATVLPPSERPGARRTSEMKELYGKGAAMIHGMETAMQLTFDRYCDIRQPNLWPNIPLNIKFKPEKYWG